jgi:hypothetical protein
MNSLTEKSPRRNETAADFYSVHLRSGFPAGLWGRTR